MDTIIYPFGVSTTNNARSWGQPLVSLSWHLLGQRLTCGKKTLDSFVERLTNFYYLVYLPAVINYINFEARICLVRWHIFEP